MPARESRFRTRFTPREKVLVKPGFSPYALKTGAWHMLKNGETKYTYLSDVYASASTPFLKAESCRDETHQGPPWNVGGPFTKISIEFPPQGVEGNGVYHGQSDRTSFGATGRLRYTGGFSNPSFLGDPTSYSSLNTLLGATSPLIPSLSGWSPTAFAKTRPVLQKASGMVFLAEARDIPRMLRSTARFFNDSWRTAGGDISPFMQPKNVADHFLNHQFGWIPFLSDLQKFSSTFQHCHALKSRMTSENGQWVKRRATLLDDYQETKLAASTGMQVEPAGDWVSTLFTIGSTPTWETWERKASIITTSGSFRYYRPEFDGSIPDYDSAWNSIQRELTLYGARISPSNVYRAVPWTWLIDWFTDFGSVVDRFTDIVQDSIAANYLFLMRHDYREVVMKQMLPMATTGPITLNFNRITDVKIRRESDSPFGFGLSWNSLSPRQLAILSALKISRK